VAAGIAFTSYGLRIGVRVNQPDALEGLVPLLPPAWKPAPTPVVDHLYSLRVGSGHAARVRAFHLLYTGTRRLARSLALDEVLASFESDLQLLVAEKARRRVFIHAGVVGWRGRALLLPGRSFTGKSTLVAALVRAGASYYSDEYAVLDPRGRVHAYPRRLSLRRSDGEAPDRLTPESLGGRAGRGPLPVGLIAVTHYQPEARWRPRSLSAGQAALALLDNAVPAIRKPAAVLDTLGTIVSSARALKGVRGEAESVAESLLRRLDELSRMDAS